LHFNEKYEFVKVINIPPVKERTAILQFREKVNSQNVVTVRCLPEKETTQKEIQTLYKVENMRKTLELKTIVTTHGYFIGQDPFKLYNIPEEANKPKYIGTYYYIIMDYIPLNWQNLRENLGEFDAMEVQDMILELFYTIWQARSTFKFYHGDLHPGNIMFIEVSDERTYYINNLKFTCVSNYMPVIIDFEKALFDEKNQTEKLSDIRTIVVTAQQFFTHYQIDESDEFKTLYSTVVGYRNQSDDSRFKPGTIPKLLLEQDFFEGLVEEIKKKSKIEGVEECVSCRVKNAMFVCSKCHVPLCSNVCMQQSYKDFFRCHK